MWPVGGSKVSLRHELDDRRNERVPELASNRLLHRPQHNVMLARTLRMKISLERDLPIVIAIDPDVPAHLV